MNGFGLFAESEGKADLAYVPNFLNMVNVRLHEILFCMQGISWETKQEAKKRDNFEFH